jgi:hypothetical protein
MKIVAHSQINKVKNSDVCLVEEYPLEDNDINGAVIEIKGRYPDTE